ncbi:hypothetical protein L195_g051342 [Trifolium pratense]|nr:hypothetical protein L195_g051342 [Trifolium pratense]CAJ2634730.1 unnamed protein product [Trifolium pratense]CAJ2645750.1 unnamed protein product [Trifolium pratense]
MHLLSHHPRTATPPLTHCFLYGNSALNPGGNNEVAIAAVIFVKKSPPTSVVEKLSSPRSVMEESPSHRRSFCSSRSGVNVLFLQLTI